MSLLSVEYVRKGVLTADMRRQLLQVAGGWALSPSVPVGTGPADLRFYRGGFNRLDHVFPERSDAERYLRQHNWQQAQGGQNATKPAAKADKT